MFWVHKKTSLCKVSYACTKLMFDSKETPDNNHFGVIYIHVYFPIIKFSKPLVPSISN